ncbi:uncharacterized protein LOC128853808 [Cuculus canorus]|uniref:uncharacterized protein LOC128853808 n=1 Tax=Cuculus canorus TaxID=55661 RepID=UPI0023AA4C1E|nr:uncharacterized protein LOC128853808 [Cuculus canorus]
MNCGFRARRFYGTRVQRLVTFPCAEPALLRSTQPSSGLSPRAERLWLICATSQRPTAVLLLRSPYTPEQAAVLLVETLGMPVLRSHVIKKPGKFWGLTATLHSSHSWITEIWMIISGTSKLEFCETRRHIRSILLLSCSTELPTDSPFSKLTFGKWKQNGSSLKPDSSLHGTKQGRGVLQNSRFFAHLPKHIVIYQKCS